MANNLYPCIIDATMPAFARKQGCKVYFSLSNFNDINDINQEYVQVSVRNQKSNKSVLKNTKTEVLLTPLQQELDGRYFIHIKYEDIKGGFQLNNYYKVQIRFIEHDCTPEFIEGTNYPTLSWLSENKQLFSEWSTVCIIHDISAPTIDIKNFEPSSQNASSILDFSSINLVGRVLFNKDDSEVLKQFRVIVTDLNDTVLIDSGNVYTSRQEDVNEIKYNFYYDFKNNTYYVIKLSIETINGYKKTEKYTFQMREKNAPKDITLSVEPVAEYGGMKVTITPSAVIFDNVIIRRACSDTNYSYWEDIYITLVNSDQPIEWIDYTVEGGKSYKYAVQLADSKGHRTGAISSAAIMADLENLFLMADNKQLRIQFDGSVKSPKRNIQINKQTTLGSKYPFLNRNGVMDYYTYNIEGTISFLDDDLFASEKTLFIGEHLQCYNNYKELHQINEYNDYFLEKAYRDKVLEFLYADNVKLLRTLTEGNHIVRITDVTLNPKTELGNYIYSFSATAEEVDEYSINVLDKYNINTIGKVQLVADKYTTMIEFTDVDGDVFSKLKYVIENDFSFDKNKYEAVIEYIDDVAIQTSTTPASFIINKTLLELDSKDILTLKSSKEIPMKITSCTAESALTNGKFSCAVYYRKQEKNVPDFYYYKLLKGEIMEYYAADTYNIFKVIKERYSSQNVMYIQEITLHNLATDVVLKQDGKEDIIVEANENSSYTLGNVDQEITSLQIKNAAAAQFHISYTIAVEKGVYFK